MKWNFAAEAVAVVCLTAMAAVPAARAQTNPIAAEVITNGPQTGPGDRPDPRAGEQNRRDSARYESAVRSDPHYRAAREHKECGSIDDARMRGDCLATFDR